MGPEGVDISQARVPKADRRLPSATPRRWSTTRGVAMRDRNNPNNAAIVEVLFGPMISGEMRRRLIADSPDGLSEVRG